MEAQSTAPARVRAPRWRWIAAAIAALVLAGAALWFFVIRGDGGGTVSGPPDAPFTVTRPSGWESTSEEELSALPGSPAAVLRQDEGKGIVVINVQPPTRATLPRLQRRLQTRLERRFSDFQLVSAQQVDVAAGPAASISYVRTRNGTANTMLVVPANARLYTLSAVVPAGEEGIAQEAGSILASFDG